MAKDLEVRTVFRAVDKVSRTVGRMRQRVTRFANRSARAMKRLDKRVSAVAGGLTRGLKFGATAAAGAALGLFAAVTKTAQAMDTLAKTARSVNFPIEEFQEFRFVAEQSGVNSEVFNKSIQKFTRSMGELRGGYGSLYTALKKSNPRLLKQLKTTDDIAVAFDTYLKSIGKAPTAMDKAALSAAGFGRAGIDMINMANLSAKEIDNLRAQMRENGLVTAEQADKAEEYNDMMNRLKLTITGLVVDVLTPLMPILKDLANRIRVWAVANKELISGNLKEYMTWLIDNFPLIVKWIKKIGVVLAVFYAFAAAVKAVTLVMTIFNAIMMANPIMLIVVAFAAAMAAIWLFRDEIDAFVFKIFDAFAAAGKAIKSFFVGIWEKIRPVVEPVFKFVKTYIGELVDLFTGRWDEAGKKFIRLWDMIKTAASSALDWILDKLGPIGDALREIGKFFSGDGGGAPSPVPKPPKAPGLPKPEGLSPIPDVSGVGGGAASRVAAAEPGAAVRPQVRTSKTETVAREETEVTLRDETGRAEVTKGGRGRGFKLVHTGGMP